MSNITIGLAGIVIILVGLVLFDREVLATPLISIGASILSASVVNWLLTKRFDSIPINSIIEALAQKTQFIRVKHTVDLIFSIKNDKLQLQKRHKYILRNPSRFTRSREISMFTDAPVPIINEKYGFEVIIEPDGTQLTGQALQKHVRFINGKHVFSKCYDLSPGDGNSFEFRSYGYYRMNDRLIWTVEDLCEDFEIRIINNTGVDSPFEVKVNHHRESEISSKIKYLNESNEIILDFDVEILPYQGFELMWEITQ